MENASKALIIAGAILISIVLISLGVSILQQGQDTVKKSSMTAEELQTFNSKFIGYEGNISGSQLKALIGQIIANNQAEGTNGTNSGYTVQLNGALPTTTATVTGQAGGAAIGTAARYTVTMAYDAGRINNITVN